MFDIRELNIAFELWGVALCVLGNACLLLFSRSEGSYRRIIFTMFTLELIAAGGDAVAGIFRGRSGIIAWQATHLGNFATFSANFFLLAVFTSYLCERMREVGATHVRRWRAGALVAAAVMSLLTALGTFYTIDAANLYHRSDLYWMTYAYALVLGLVDFFLLMRSRKDLERSAFWCLLFYIIAPLLAMSVQVYVYGLNFLIIASVIGTVVLFLETRARSARILVERTKELAQSRVELSESRIAAMVSQIQPHFMFNTLDSIYYLCGEDPERAQTAVDRFSTYLRANLASLRSTAPVPINTELAHVRTYLDLEKLSMEDLLEWEVDAQADGFSVPALSLQTLTENAVRHGVGKRPGGGRVVVRTRETPDSWVATVEDDGVGFDTQQAIDEGHVGLENTRMRLASMCDGSLEITSTPGVGTRAVIRIPKQRG